MQKLQKTNSSDMILHSFVAFNRDIKLSAYIMDIIVDIFDVDEKPADDRPTYLHIYKVSWFYKFLLFRIFIFKVIYSFRFKKNTPHWFSQLHTYLNKTIIVHKSYSEFIILWKSVSAQMYVKQCFCSCTWFMYLYSYESWMNCKYRMEIYNSIWVDYFNAH